MAGSEERRDGGGCLVIECPSLQRIMARWVLRLRKMRPKKNVVISEEKETDFSMMVRCSTNVLTGGESNEPGFQRKETTFNMGIGCCLMYLIAASRIELNKMAELSTEIQKLLENTKRELEKRDLPEADDDITTPTLESIEASSFTFPASSTSKAFDQSLSYDASKPEESFEERNQLEAELETELERLQLRVDMEKKYMKLPMQQTSKVSVDDFASTGSNIYEETITHATEPQEELPNWHRGVSPYELTTKLHELIEARQLEQITELETALKCTKQKLIDKETEVSWWKDTARLFSNHVPMSLRTKHLSFRMRVSESE